MSSIEGMDTGQVESLANQIDANAQALYNLVTSLNGVIGGLVFLWNGPVAAHFEQQWQSKNRPALLNAHALLVNLHSELIKNVNQQKSASAADGGWTAERVVGDFENVLKYKDAVTLAGKADLLEDSHLAPLVLPLDVLATGISAWHTADDAYHVGDDLWDHHYANAGNEAVETVADGVKTAGLAAETTVGAMAEIGFDVSAVDPIPAVIIGTGVDITLLHEAATLDWKDTPAPWSGNAWSQDYVPSLAHEFGSKAGWKQIGDTLLGALP